MIAKKNVSPRKIELLAPAKDAQIAIDAINYGADAVYMGASKFGARAMAGNTLNEIGRVADYAHKFNAKLYATVNTIIYESELLEVEHLIKNLYNVGVDALIIQDMSILRLDIPPIALHSSTQCDLRTPQKAKFLEEVGFSQLVMARELSLDEIRDIHNATDAKLEAFIYGALCVSYSGRCQVSEVLKGRSANRGECAQICRMAYDLIDENGNEFVSNRHLLSLKDLNQSGKLLALMDAGVSSFKIEGRLKDANYVKNSVAYFRKEIDEIISQNTEKYARSSAGRCDSDFSPSLEKCFNRTYTHYFLENRNQPNGKKMASALTPKSQGEYLGKLRFKNGKNIRIDTKIKINNGDGLSFFDGKEFSGFRVNKVENGTISVFGDVYIPPKAEIYRTYNKEFDDAINCSRTERKLYVDFVLREANDLIVLDAKDELGNATTIAQIADNLEVAKTDQSKRQQETLKKLGGTIYKTSLIKISTDKFIPMSVLSDLRRRAIESLEKNQKIRYYREIRKMENMDAGCFSEILVSADNVANRVSESFYKSHGVKEITPAIEVDQSAYNPENVLMHTRYCIRRELGVCRKSNQGGNLPDKLFLRNGQNLLSLECDCANCEMKIRLIKR